MCDLHSCDMANSLYNNESQWLKPGQGDFQLKTHDITDDYEIYGTILGSGANGFVYACKSKTSREMYALKVLRDGKCSRKEVNLHWLACVSNCIVNIEDVYKNIWDGQPSTLVVLEYMAGGDLWKRTLTAGRLTEDQAVTIVKRIVQAVTHLHAMNIVHCDLKPHNFLFKTNSLDSPLKLTDFGLARLVTPENMMHTESCPAYYRYYSPEVLRGEKRDKPCDMWALGCTAFMLLSGCTPFNTQNVAGVTPGMTHGECTFSETSWSHISHEAKDLIRQLLKTDPKERMSLEEMRVHPWITGNGMNNPSNTITAPRASSEVSVVTVEPTPSLHVNGD